MKICLYSGMLKLVSKSGVGQAMLQQKEILARAGIETVPRYDASCSIVHINTVFPDAVFTALRAKRQNKKIIWYGHSTMEDFRNSFKGSNLLAPLFRLWIKYCYSLGDIIITPTVYSQKLLRAYGIKKPICTLSNGVDTDFFSCCASSRKSFRDMYHLGEEDKVVVSAGHYIERKGILDFICLAKEMPEINFFWFGYTNSKLIPAKIRKAIENAPSNLCFPGFVSREELRNAYCGSDLFAFLSYEETEGLVVLEALSCGVPTIVRNIPVYDGWLIEGKNTYKADNYQMFRSKIKTILQNELPNLTAGGRKVAEERSFTVISEQLIRFYAGLIR